MSSKEAILSRLRGAATPIAHALMAGSPGTGQMMARGVSASLPGSAPATPRSSPSRRQPLPGI